jgi:hypothetical protein
MQLNKWVILGAALLVLLVIARYIQHLYRSPDRAGVPSVTASLA